ncbi:DUF805 domain-containing protein [Apilactobacillus micheneri]|uniref:DUF805 domain-containing protein n=1 Tax=Apilactobacillus micheneri TaxID=1899430 RepID=UPI0013001645|nr:DUF805 domain-containing protein [Apilactobacillus micheneri]
MNAYFKFWKNIFNYKDKTNIKDFFIPQIINIGLIILFMLLANMVNNINNIIILTFVKLIIGFIIISLIPEISLMVRRYRDSGTPVYYFLIILVLMLIGNILLKDVKIISYVGKIAHLFNLYFLFKSTKKADN